MNFMLDTPSRRIAFTIGISVLLHGLLLWIPDIKLPQFKASLPPLVAKLETLPNAPAKPKPKRKISSAPKPVPEVEPARQDTPAEDIPLAASAVATANEVAAASAVAAVANEIAAVSAPAATEALAQSGSTNVIERPRLPRRAQLIFSVNKGTGDFKIGEVMHTLEIENGRYVLQSVTETVGLAKLIKTYKITQYSSGSYTEEGLQPEQFFEERADRLATLRNTVEFDHAEQRARFSHGGEAALPPDTQDILSILYQFPPLANAETVTTFVSNGKKIERYEFEIAANEDIQTTMGELRAVHLRKLHLPNEEGLEVWLALEYRLFPVKMRIIERDGEISGEIVITDIHAEFEEETKQDADH